MQTAHVGNHMGGFLISRKDLAALMREKEKVVFPGNQKGPNWA
jgi:hypothetical protein